ncbi:MAG: para-nitrobenzyl esterase [Gammaproteobacteria bacterium]|jgi:para-nitrobenzyl esterase
MLNRLCILTFIATLVACSPYDYAEKTTVAAPSVMAAGEVLIGKWSAERQQQAHFFGIPFAAPPVGEARFRPPANHAPRSGEQRATEFGSACVQEQGNPDWYRSVARGVGAKNAVIPDLEAISEDCLSLNVWTENLAGKEKWPVLVWIYGGSNRNGFSHEPNYHGHRVATKGVVYVSINYRVGPLGFMSHPALTAESEHQSSGNYGLLDQIKALQWVKNNIAAFGGDPAAVTISGESAGAGNSANLIASPLAAGLFKGAILQSGGMRMSYTPNLADNETVGESLAEALGINHGADVAAQLREIPALKIMQKQRELISNYNDVVDDGWVLPSSARSTVESGGHNRVDILTGSNAQEWLMYFPSTSGEEEYQQALEYYGEANSAAFRTLLDATGLSAIEKRDLMFSGSSFHCVASKLAGDISHHGNNAFLYRFTRVRPGSEALMAYHGAEIPYAFDTADDWLPADGVDKKLTHAMLEYWTNFVKTGNPNGRGLPEWPRYSSSSRAYMELGDNIKAGDDLDRKFCALMEATWNDKLEAAKQ